MLGGVVPATHFTVSDTALTCKCHDTDLLEEKAEAILTTDVRVQINFSDTNLMQMIDGSLTLASPASVTTKT